MTEPALPSAILDSLSEGVFTVDHDWKITSFNRAAEEITGILRDEALGQYCADVLHSNLCEHRCPIRAAMSAGAPLQNQRGYFVDADGLPVPISLSAAVLYDADGQPLGGVETFRDLSEVEALRRQLRQQSVSVASRHPAMQQLLALVPVLAKNPASVLIEGETGTDRDKPGRFALARDGTLFLDEVGDICVALQSRLLRVLQEREFEPLGGTRAEPMHARIISASHRRLKKMVKAGDFREDLYYRLDVVRLEIPPLRERASDIPALAAQLFERSRQAMGSEVQGFTPEAIAALQKHDWPGNIRELANVIERAVVLCPGEWIGVGDLPPELQTIATPRPAARIRQQAEAAAIRAALQEHDFNRGKTAAALGMHPSSLYRKIKAWGLV